MPDRNYPATVAEVLDDNMKFRPQALYELRRFKKSRPWHGTTEERIEKFRSLNHLLSVAYDMVVPELRFSCLGDNDSGRSNYVGYYHQITLVGKLSVITYLHEFAHARGMGERGACRWSINIFRRVFPKQFAKLRAVGHVLVSPNQN